MCSISGDVFVSAFMYFGDIGSGPSTLCGFNDLIAVAISSLGLCRNHF